MKKKIRLITTTALAAALIASCEPKEKTPSNTTGLFPAQTDITEPLDKDTESRENDYPNSDIAGLMPEPEIIPEPPKPTPQDNPDNDADGTIPLIPKDEIPETEVPDVGKDDNFVTVDK